MLPEHAPAYGMAAEALVPLRTGPSHRAELGSCLLFGECGLLLEPSADGEWLRWQGLHDGYEGWVRAAMLHPVGAQAPVAYRFLRAELAAEVIHGGVVTELRLHRGSRLPVVEAFDETNEVTLPLPEDRILRTAASDWHYAEPLPSSSAAVQALLDDMLRHYLNAPYLWGGRSPAGVDCSGLLQVNFALAGLELPRDAWQQAEVGTDVAPADARAGDVASFAGDSGLVTHIGILLQPDRILHAAGSGRVRIDGFSPQGIHNPHTRQLTHRLHGIKRHFLF